MAKWFSAAVHPTIGIVHVFDAACTAKDTSFSIDSSLGYCLRLRVNLRDLLDHLAVRSTGADLSDLLPDAPVQARNRLAA